MNRQQRRKQKKSNINPEIQMKYLIDKRIKFYNDKEKRKKEDVSIEVFYKFIYLTVLAERDLYGYGKKRLARTVSKIIDLTESVAMNYITPDDIMETIKDETKLDLKELLNDLGKGLKV